MSVESPNYPIGWFVTSATPFNFSMYPYSDQNLTQARRINQLERAPFMTLNLDARQAGLGTATCGPDVDAPYLITDSIFDFSLCFRPYRVGKQEVEDLYQYASPSVDSLLTATPEIRVSMNGNVDYRLFNQPLTVTLSCADASAKLYYTLDGTEPTEKSALYKKPFKIDSSCVLSVMAVVKGKMPSFIAHRCFERQYIKNTTYVNLPASRYSADADIALMDGKIGQPDHWDKHWLGFCGDHLDAVIELTEPLNIKTVWIGICHAPQSWVIWPKSAWVCFSKDGIDFSNCRRAEFPVYDTPDSMVSLGRVEARVKVDEKDVRYIRVYVENQGELPSWHPYAGEKAWIMVDEVRIER